MHGVDIASAGLGDARGGWCASTIQRCAGWMVHAGTILRCAGWMVCQQDSAMRGADEVHLIG